MHRPLSAACLGALLSLSAPAQMFVCGAPPGTMPLVTPLAPAFAQSSPTSSPTNPAAGAPCMPTEPRDPTTQGTQLEGLGQLRDPEPGGTGLEAGERHRTQSVAVGVGLDHGHPRRGGDLGEDVGVVPDRVEVNDGARRGGAGPGR